MNDGEIRRRAALALAGPLPEFVAMTSLNEADPPSGVSLRPLGNALTAMGAPQAGVLSAALEIAAYLALLPQLADDEDAVTHQISVSYLARAKGDSALVAKGAVLQRTRRLGFVSADLHQADRQLAAAQVTKSILVT